MVSMMDSNPIGQDSSSWGRANKELWCKCGVSRWTENPEVTVRLRMVPQKKIV